MYRHEVEERLSRIFIKRSSINFLREPEKRSLKLLSRSGIPARELLHVYFDVKKAFNVLIPEDDVAGGRFDTFDNIVELIYEQLHGHGSA